MPFIPGDEDCLFLNVYAPANAKDLPVLVWIHGGGYGMGDASQDMSEIIAANDNGFVAVVIQYRVSAASEVPHFHANISTSSVPLASSHQARSRQREWSTRVS